MIENAVTQDTFVEYDDHRNELETYFIVPATIGPEDGRHLFSYLGVFLTYITPRDLTVGMKFILIRFQFSVFNGCFFLLKREIWKKKNRHTSQFILYLLFLCGLVAVNCILELLKNVFDTKVSVVNLIWEVSWFYLMHFIFPLSLFASQSISGWNWIKMILWIGVKCS